MVALAISRRKSPVPWAKVTVFTRKKDKLDEIEKLGFTAVLESDKDAMAKLKSSFDFILSMIAERHDVNPFVDLLKRDGTLTVVGALEPVAPANN